MSNGYQASFWGDEKVLELTVVMAVHFEYTKIY